VGVFIIADTPKGQNTFDVDVDVDAGAICSHVDLESFVLHHSCAVPPADVHPFHVLLK